MTNLHLAILSTVLTLAILGALWEAHRRILSYFSTLTSLMLGQANILESSLRSHVVDEIDNLEKHVTDRAHWLKTEIWDNEDAIVEFVKTHADALHTHAEDLRNHAKELSDRAEVQASSPRQAVTRN